MSDKKITLLDIIKSRYSDKTDITDWNKRRLKICSTCNWNSDNKSKEELTLQEKGWIKLNHGKSTCLSCTCMLEAKASLPHAKCPLPRPKWGVVQTFAESSTEKIVNISTTPIKMSTLGNEIILDYGIIPIGEPTDVQLLIVDKEDKMTNISASASCGCTVPKLEKKGKEITLKINYDTKREGDFTKTVLLSYIKNSINFERIFKITGKTK